MPVTRSRAAAAARVEAVVEEEDERAAAIDISSDSDEGSEPSSEEEDTSDEDFVEISDSDSEAGGGEESGEESEKDVEAEAETEQLGVDRSEAACSKIAGLLRSGKILEGVKLVECKAYLKKIGLSQTGDITTCMDRIMLHWRFKDRTPENIYPRSSFCINCKGDVCRGDAVLFKQKVYEKSGKRHSKCIGKRIVAGKVIKESYGKQKQQHTFTIEVFWSRGVGKLLPLHLLLVKGRNLYRMMTFRQPWANEAERLKALEEKHNRGDAARRVRSLNRHKPAGNTLKGKKTLDKEKHQARSGRSDCGSNITDVDKCKKRSSQSSNFGQPNKRFKKDGCDLPSMGKCAGDRRAKKNRGHLDKGICIGHKSSLCSGSREKNNANFQKSCHLAPLNNGPSSKEVGIDKGKPRSEQKNSISHAQFEGRCITQAPHVQANRGIFAGIHHPFSERPQGPPPLREIGNAWLPHPPGSSVACPNHTDALFNTTMGFRHQNAALATPHAPAYFGQFLPNQQRVAFPSQNIQETVFHPRPEVVYNAPHYRYCGAGGAVFRR